MRPGRRAVLGLVLLGSWWCSTAAISGEPAKQSVTDVVGARKGQLGFETKPLLGLTTAEVRATYAAVLGTADTTKVYSLKLPGLREHKQQVVVDLFFLDDKVVHYAVGFHQSLEPQLMKQLQAVYGAPEQRGQGDWLFSRKPLVRLLKKTSAYTTPVFELSITDPKQERLLDLR